MSSGSADICVSSTSLKKNDIGWPQQPPTEKYQISVKNWIFDDPFHKKGSVLFILVSGMIQSSEPGSSFGLNRVLEAVEAIEVADTCEVKEAAEILRPEKSLSKTIVIKVLRFSFILMF